MNILEGMKNDVNTKGFEEWREYTETLLAISFVMNILEGMKNDVNTKGFEEWREYTETLLANGAERRAACSTCAVLNPFNAFAFLLKGARPTQWQIPNDASGHN